MKIAWKIFKWLSAVLAAFLVITTVWFLISAVDHPPKVSDMSALETHRVKAGDNTYFVGSNWLRRSETGLWEMYIEGDPFERGVAFGKLAQELLRYQEEAFVEQIRILVPSDAYLKFLKYFLAWFNRNLDKNIPEEYKLEIYGTSFSCSPEFDFIGSGYQRQLNYHAAHDIGHALQGLNLVGCTSFAVWGKKSADSTLLVGRNFDFYAGRKFSENKIVCFVNPTEGNRFMMITWAGMIGVVSGMNEKGLTVTINAASSTVPGQAATPVSIVAREILQYASTIEEAYEIAGQRKMFVSESLLTGSAEDGISAIIEKSPETTGMFYPDSDQIICTNHFQGETFREDKHNIENILGTDSKYRYERVSELLAADSLIDVTDAVSILRNRYGLNNIELGMGNPMAINQLIAHHSVVFKPSYLTAWVSTPPWQLGRYVAYDLKRVFSMNDSTIAGSREITTMELTVPEDPFLKTEAYGDFIRYQGMRDVLIKARKEKKELPQGFEDAFLSANPLYYATYSDLADYYAVSGNQEKAHHYYELALSMQVPGKEVRDELEKKSETSLNKMNNGKEVH
jgi:hypothetical protein